MSKAFTKEDDGGPEPSVIPQRAPLPRGVPNYVTRRGLAMLRAELAAMVPPAPSFSLGRGAPDGGGEGDAGRRRTAESADARRRELEARIATAVVVEPPAAGQPEVRFGAQVAVRFSTGVRRDYRIVGVDEANATAGLIAFVAPMARALLGRRAGDIITLRTPGGEEDLEIVAVTYQDPEPGRP